MNIEQPIQSIVTGSAVMTDPSAQVAAHAEAAVAAAKAAAALVRKQSEPAADSVKAAAQQIDTYLKSTGRNLNFRVDDATGQTVVTVRDATTGDVIRQIPSEEVLRLARSLGESSAALFDQSV
jgi:flagellar protein FlaG